MPLRLVRHPKRSPHWYIRGTVRGQAVFETTGTSDKPAADALRIIRESQLLNRSVFGTSANVTFLEAAVSYVEAGGEARFVTKITDEIGGLHLLEIDQDRADITARKLYPTAGPATRKRQFYIPLCAVLNHSAKRKWCPKPMIEHPSVPEPTTTFSSPSRLARLLPHCTSRNMRLFVTMLAYTGERLEQIVFLNWDRDINLARRTITFQRTKNGTMRTVPIHDALLIELSAVPEEKRRGRVFHWRHKTAVHPPLKNACKRAGIDYLPPHQQGRHTFGTWLRTYAKRDLKGIMQDGGWKDARSAMRYLHTDPGESEDAVSKLPMVQNPCTTKIESAKVMRVKKKLA